MYIIFETIGFDDPRMDARIQVIGKWWHYDIAFIDDQHTDLTSAYQLLLKGVELTEVVAKSNKLCDSNDGEIALVNANFTNYDEIVQPSSLSSGNSYVKQMYFLTDEDKANCVAFMKAGMKLHTNKYLTTDDAKKTRLLELIDQLDPNDLNATQMFLHSYFPWDNGYTNLKPRTREFDVPWMA